MSKLQQKCFSDVKKADENPLVKALSKTYRIIYSRKAVYYQVSTHTLFPFPVTVHVQATHIHKHLYRLRSIETIIAKQEVNIKEALDTVNT